MSVRLRLENKLIEVSSFIKQMRHGQTDPAFQECFAQSRWICDFLQRARLRKRVFVRYSATGLVAPAAADEDADEDAVVDDETHAAAAAVVHGLAVAAAGQGPRWCVWNRKISDVQAG